MWAAQWGAAWPPFSLSPFFASHAGWKLQIEKRVSGLQKRKISEAFKHTRSVERGLVPVLPFITYHLKSGVLVSSAKHLSALVRSFASVSFLNFRPLKWPWRHFSLVGFRSLKHRKHLLSRTGDNYSMKLLANKFSLTVWHVIWCHKRPSESFWRCR